VNRPVASLLRLSLSGLARQRIARNLLTVKHLPFIEAANWLCLTESRTYGRQHRGMACFT
jgi:hypothetical protein